MNAEKKITPAHEQRETLAEDVLYPAHVQRTESPEFTRNKHRLVRKLNLGCWICDSKDQREVHHFACEWALWESVDPEKVLATAHAIDPYGFAAHDPETPIASPDDIRNLMVLCEPHHRGAGTGVHRISWPIWLAQRVARAGVQIARPIAKAA